MASSCSCRSQSVHPGSREKEGRKREERVRRGGKLAEREEGERERREREERDRMKGDNMKCVVTVERIWRVSQRVPRGGVADVHHHLEVDEVESCLARCVPVAGLQARGILARSDEITGLAAG